MLKNLVKENILRDNNDTILSMYPVSAPDKIRSNADFRRVIISLIVCIET